ncbi:hypothetical protein BC941DRAFT_467945 [Chlamydoabsidia padenii]|nr:hypothetical protein BC941DRAFT_467945 [Chlamydoabsidia padenii]
MPLARSQSHSNSSNNPHKSNIFSGFQNWRRRRASTSVPASPMGVTSPSTSTNNDPASFPTSSGSERPSSDQPRQQPNQLYQPDVTFENIADNTVNPPPTNRDKPSNASSQHNLPIRLLPNIGLNSQCFMFDIIDRVLTPTTVLLLGRYSDHHTMHNRLSFKSKVVSRTHAELWMEDGKKIFIRDTGSSSGTFVNRTRLSASNEVSEPMELKDGDIIQLGMDYQGGMEQVYRAVKIRLEINRNNDHQSNSFSRHAFQQLQQHLMETQSPDSSPHTKNTNDTELEATTLKVLPNNNNGGIINTSSVQECCICLYAIAPLQALFVAPCSHVFHFKCLRPIVFQHYPGFSCPLCRNYYDLEASVAIEVSEVIEAMSSTQRHSYLPETSNIITDEGSSSLPILSSSSIRRHSASPSPPKHQNNHDDDNGISGHGEDRQQHNETDRVQMNADGLLLSSTLVDPSMLDQEGVHNNLSSSL